MNIALRTNVPHSPLSDRKNIPTFHKIMTNRYKYPLLGRDQSYCVKIKTVLFKQKMIWARHQDGWIWLIIYLFCKEDIFFFITPSALILEQECSYSFRLVPLFLWDRLSGVFKLCQYFKKNVYSTYANKHNTIGVVITINN